MGQVVDGTTPQGRLCPLWQSNVLQFSVLRGEHQPCLESCQVGSSHRVEPSTRGEPMCDRGVRFIANQRDAAVTLTSSGWVWGIPKRDTATLPSTVWTEGKGGSHRNLSVVIIFLMAPYYYYYLMIYITTNHWGNNLEPYRINVSKAGKSTMSHSRLLCFMLDPLFANLLMACGSAFSLSLYKNPPSE